MSGLRHRICFWPGGVLEVGKRQNLVGEVHSVKNEPAGLEEIPTRELHALIAETCEDTPPVDGLVGRIDRNVGWPTVNTDTEAVHLLSFPYS